MLAAIHIGADPFLLETRGALLQSVGLKVVNLAGNSGVMEAIRAAPFDVAVLCHSLAPSDRLRLARAIRKCHPSAFILLISGQRDVSADEKEEIDAVLDPAPQRLLDDLRERLRLIEESESLPRPENRSRPKTRQA